MENLTPFFSFGIFLLAFLSLLGVVFNVLLNPIKEQIADLKDSQKELKDSHKELKASQQALNDKMDKLLAKK